jgi:hypothetical protein
MQIKRSIVLFILGLMVGLVLQLYNIAVTPFRAIVIALLLSAIVGCTSAPVVIAKSPFDDCASLCRTQKVKSYQDETRSCNCK